jgi:hypothetical protein
MLDWALANGCPFPVTYTCLLSAFVNEHEDVLDWFVKNDFGLNAETCARAALEGDFKFFRWLHRNDCPWDERSCANAAANGHYKILEYARLLRCPSKTYPIDAERRATGKYKKEAQVNTMANRLFNKSAELSYLSSASLL